MQIKIFSIPIPGGEQINDEMNVFLRSKRVLQVDSEFVSNAGGSFWCFCVKYLDEAAPFNKEKVDYKQVLDDDSFQRFSRMRELRKQLAKDDGIPAYAVFTDEELSRMASVKELTPASLKSIKGIGEKRVEKYGHYFFTNNTHEKSE